MSYYALSSDMITYQNNNYFQTKMSCEKSPSPAGSLDSGLGWSPIYTQSEHAMTERNVLRYCDVMEPSEVAEASYKHEERQQPLSQSQSSTISSSQYLTESNLSIAELQLSRNINERFSVEPLPAQSLRHQVNEAISNCTRKQINLSVAHRQTLENNIQPTRKIPASKKKEMNKKNKKTNSKNIPQKKPLTVKETLIRLRNRERQRHSSIANSYYYDERACFFAGQHTAATADGIQCYPPSSAYSFDYGSTSRPMSFPPQSNPAHQYHYLNDATRSYQPEDGVSTKHSVPQFAPNHELLPGNEAYHYYNFNPNLPMTSSSSHDIYLNQNTATSVLPNDALEVSSMPLRGDEVGVEALCQPFHAPLPQPYESGEFLPPVSSTVHYSSDNHNFVVDSIARNLFYLIRTGSSHQLREVLAQSPELVHFVYEDEKTLIFHAIECSNLEAVMILLNFQCNIFVETSEGNTVLHYSAKCPNGKILEWLLEYLDHSQTAEVSAALVNKPCKTGTTPLHEAASLKHHQHLKLLLQHGANWLTQNLNGLSALHLSVKICDIASIRIFIDFIEKCFTANDTRSKEIVLTKWKELCNQPTNQDYSTPLHLCTGLLCSTNNDIILLAQQMIEIFLLHGADIYIRDANGKTPHELLPPPMTSQVIASVHRLFDKARGSYSEGASHQQHYVTSVADALHSPNCDEEYIAFSQ